MLEQDNHLSDEELLLVADGELPSRRAIAARRHLSSCWRCRTRMGEMETTIADFVRTHHRSLDPRLPAVAGSRALLKARLTELAAGPESNFWHHLMRFAFSRTALACVCAVLAIAGLSFSAYRHFSTNTGSTLAAVEPAAVPRSDLTPGAIRLISTDDVCRARSDDADEVSAPLQQKVFQEYGIPSARPTDYEVDYLITPQLGGATDIRNLWPEPHSSTAWNSYVKDDLEDRLHQLVCQGKVALPVAQREIATNWISAYKKYFHTDQPVTRRAQLSSTHEIQIRVHG